MGELKKPWPIIHKSMRNRFKDWLVFHEEISWVDALKIFGYKPGDFIDADDYKKRYRTLVMTHHPDRGGNHADMVNVTLANNALQHFVGKQIPGSAGPSASTPPPRPEPKPEPKPSTANWGDPGLHAAARRDFGKWLHGGIIEMSDYADKHRNSRNQENLFDAVNHLVELVSRSRRAFVEWQMKTRETTMLHSDDFYQLLFRLDTPDESAKGYRAALKAFKEELVGSFYDKYIKDFPPTI